MVNHSVATSAAVHQNNVANFFAFGLLGNGTDGGGNSSSTDFDGNITPAEDVSVETVVASIKYNTIICVFLMVFYEFMRRALPAVYSSRKRQERRRMDAAAASAAAAGGTDAVDDSPSACAGRAARYYVPAATEDDDDIIINENDDNNDADNNDNGGNNNNDNGINNNDENVDPHHGAIDDKNDQITGNHDRNDGDGDGGTGTGNDGDDADIDIPAVGERREERPGWIRSIMSHLPDDQPLDWVAPVLGVPWSVVRKRAGLDGYFFLRFIRMCVRITAVSSVWFFLTLVPIYWSANYTERTAAKGWYHFSAANVPRDNWRMWVLVLFAYLFTAFVIFVIEQEYKHFLELRQSFLAVGTENVHPQHHYSLQIENIPPALRSDRALFEYFEKLFPGKVHSASVVLNLPDLQAVSARSLRICRRLEKSIAQTYATGRRPTHNVGRARLTCLGIDLEPVEWCCNTLRGSSRGGGGGGGDGNNAPDEAVVFDNNDLRPFRPERGTRVDSISYYTHELSEASRDLFRMQSTKTKIARSGNLSNRAGTWLDQIMHEASQVGDRIMQESELDNAYYYTAEDDNVVVAAAASGQVSPHREEASPAVSVGMCSPFVATYGSFPNTTTTTSTLHQQPQQQQQFTQTSTMGLSPFQTQTRTTRDLQTGLVSYDQLQTQEQQEECAPTVSPVFSKQQQQQQQEHDEECAPTVYVPQEPFGSTQYSSTVRRWLGRLGLDFIVAATRFLHSQLDVTLEGVIGTTMSSTGFVTFTELAATTCAATAPLTSQARVLDVSVAPEAQEILWENAHVTRQVQTRREQATTVALALGVVLWSFPVAAIQAFSKADFLAQIPGLEWILTFDGGSIKSLVNGYLPVVALLGLILILPVIFEQVAVHYERRKTFSDVQASMVGRYFYYQLVNIYVTVTAGSVWKALHHIIDHPQKALELLGESLPTMVGYFIALLVTKIMAGLPMIFLRFGAASRMLFLKALAKEPKLTQRELDAMYRLENVQYGWEFPTQLLVVVIVFTYAIICPVILPVGFLYFSGALVVYKKQILYVYSPVYESGGAMFPLAVQRMLVGLVCGQLTLVGYTSIRQVYQTFYLFPLPLLTLWTMEYFRVTYADASAKLSLERAVEFDERIASFSPCPISRWFDTNSYRQPVLTERATEPMTYRRGVDDPETIEVRNHLRRINQYMNGLPNNNNDGNNDDNPGDNEAQRVRHQEQDDEEQQAGMEAPLPR